MTVGDAPLCERLAVIGLGLIGGSLALSVRHLGLARTVVGCDERHQPLDEGLRLGIIDEAADRIATAVAGADLVVIAVPVQANVAVLESLRDTLPENAILTDVGSVKGRFVSDVKRVFGALPSRLVPGHPIAGSERSGVAAASATLFEDHKVILTPLDGTDAGALEAVSRLWAACGAEVLTMSVAHHDEVLAATSHLPHLIAFSLVDTLAGEEENQDIFRYAAGGFRDFTRIAASDPVMWRDIFLSNRVAVLEVLNHFSEDLEQLRGAIENGDGRRLLQVFTRAKAARDHFSRMLSGKAYLSTMSDESVTYYASAGGPVCGELRVPGDKSMSHRAIMLGALAEGVTDVEGFLEGEDSLATVQAFREMGVTVEGPEQGGLRIHGVGLHGLQQPHGPLYLGNSGTAMRLFAGLMAAQSFDTVLTGDESLTHRPMERVATPLRSMGARIDTAEGGRPPLRITGNQRLKGIDYGLPVASAQVKSCLLLAGLYAEGETLITEPAPTRDHTERMLQGFGYPVTREGATARLSGGGKLTAGPIDVPADISSAAFFIVAAAISEGSNLWLRHVGVNPTRIGVINILREMGADIELHNEQEAGGEPVADLRVRYAPLNGIRIPGDQVPLAIDEFPVIFIAAANARGRTELSGAAELRVKESDRIQVMADGLATLGVMHEVREEGIMIEGGPYGGGVVNSQGDHRVAMAFAVAALNASEAIRVDDCANVATSFPGFVVMANRAGMRVEVSGETA